MLSFNELDHNYEMLLYPNLHITITNQGGCPGFLLSFSLVVNNWVFLITFFFFTKFSIAGHAVCQNSTNLFPVHLCGKLSNYALQTRLKFQATDVYYNVQLFVWAASHHLCHVPRSGSTAEVETRTGLRPAPAWPKDWAKLAKLTKLKHFLGLDQSGLKARSVTI